MILRTNRRVTIHLPGPRSVQQWAPIFAVLYYVLLGFVGYFTLVKPHIDQVSEILLGADSGTYMNIASYMRQGGQAGVALIGLGGNFFGPVLVALVLPSGFQIALFNMVLFAWTLYAAGRIEGVDRWLFALLLMLNMETYVSMITLNKEVFALLSATLFTKYLYGERRSWFMLAIILITALFARWQQVAITLIALFFQRNGSFPRHPARILAAVVVLIGIAYPLALSRTDLSAFTIQGDNGGGIAILNAMQAHYLYPLTVFPKVAMNLFGQFLSPKYFFGAYWDRDFRDLQNQFAIHSHSLATFIVCCILWRQRKIDIRQPMIFFCGLYLAVTAVTPFIQPRYQYPVYGLLCLEAARKKAARLTVGSRLEAPTLAGSPSL